MYHGKVNAISVSTSGLKPGEHGDDTCNIAGERGVFASVSGGVAEEHGTQRAGADVVEQVNLVYDSGGTGDGRTVCSAPGVGSSVRRDSGESRQGVFGDACSDDVGIDGKGQVPARGPDDFGEGDSSDGSDGVRVGTLESCIFCGSDLGTARGSSFSSSMPSDKAFRSMAESQYDYDDSTPSRLACKDMMFQVAPLSTYLRSSVSASDLLGLGVDNAKWLAGEYYNLLAAWHTSQCTHTVAAASEIHKKLLSSQVKEFLLNAYNSMLSVESRLDDFSDFVMLLLHDERVVRHVWSYFDVVCFRHVPFPVADNQQIRVASELVLWRNKALHRFDAKFIIVAEQQFSREFATDIEAMCTKPLLCAEVVDDLPSNAQHISFKVGRLSSYYHNRYRSMAVDYMRKEVGFLDKSNYIPRAKKKGFCSKCGFEVVLDGHEERCRVSSKVLYDGDDWLGDAMLTCDVRVVLMLYDIPSSERGPLAQKYTCNAYLATYMAEMDKRIKGISERSVATAFEARYVESFRHDFIRSLDEELGFDYKRRNVKTITPLLLKMKESLNI